MNHIERDLISLAMKTISGLTTILGNPDIQPLLNKEDYELCQKTTAWALVSLDLLGEKVDAEALEWAKTVISDNKSKFPLPRIH